MSDHSIPGDRLEAAFGGLAEESRVRILRALWEMDEPSASFSELHDQTGIKDSGQFNYHLDKLRPGFVRKHNDGYALTYAGKQVIGAAVAGTYTDTDVTVDTIEIRECWHCGGTFGLRYDRGYLIVECLDCDAMLINGLPAPPVIAANYESEELLEVFNQILLKHLQTMNRGFCILCGGVTEKSIVRDMEPAWASENHLHTRIECHSCGKESYSVVGVEVMDHPVVIEFLFDHGIDIRNTPIWENDWLGEPHAEVTQENPLRIQTVVELEGDRLELVLDESLDVIDYDRE